MRMFSANVLLLTQFFPTRSPVWPARRQHSRLHWALIHVHRDALLTRRHRAIEELSVHENVPKSALFVRPGANAAQIRSAFTSEISNSIRNEK